MLVAVGLALTLFAGPLFGYAERAAGDMRAQSPYIDAVFSRGERGEGESPEAITETPP